LSAEVGKAMATPAMRERATQEGATPIGSSPAEFQQFLQREIAKWTRIIQEAGIKVD
jgi:tripartite-type tricarboxylate transporter receptor subunit TctC